MKFAKLLFFLAFSSFLFSGCNLPKSGGSPLRTTSPNTGLFPTSEPTLIPGEPLYWIQLAYNSEEMAHYTEGQEDDRPRLSLVRDPAEIPAIEKWILPQDLPSLQNVDYNEMLVVMIFSGKQGTNQHEILMNQIVTNGNKVIVSVTFTLPPEGVPLSPTLTSPYLIFEVQKMDLPENPDFVLMANGEEIDRVSLHTLDPYLSWIFRTGLPASPNSHYGAGSHFIARESISSFTGGYTVSC